MEAVKNVIGRHSAKPTKKSQLKAFSRPRHESAKISSQDKVLFSYASVRGSLIRNLDGKSAKNELIRTLYFVAEIVGIPSERVPAREIMRKYADFIYKNFDFLHTEEIPYAFELASTGVLNLKEPDHKGYFDLGWITRILRAYFNLRTERANVVRLIRELEDKMRLNIAERIRTNTRVRAQIGAYYAEYLATDRIAGPNETDAHADADFNLMYGFLEYINFIKISLETKKSLYLEAVADVESEVKSNKAALLETADGWVYSAFGLRILKYKAVRRARIMAVGRMFAVWKKSGFSPENVILLLQKSFSIINPESYNEMFHLKSQL